MSGRGKRQPASRYTPLLCSTRGVAMALCRHAIMQPRHPRISYPIITQTRAPGAGRGHHRPIDGLHRKRHDRWVSHLRDTIRWNFVAFAPNCGPKDIEHIRVSGSVGVITMSVPVPSHAHGGTRLPTPPRHGASPSTDPESYATADPVGRLHGHRAGPGRWSPDW